MLGLRALVAVASVSMLTGCGDDDVKTSPTEKLSFAGEYRLTIENVKNDCDFATWTIGQQVSDVPLSITGSGALLSAEVGGSAAGYFNTALGSTKLEGAENAGKASLTALGTPEFVENGCTYHVLATLVLEKNGAAVSGSFSYTKRGTGCEAYAGCASVQSVSGALQTP